MIICHRFPIVIMSSPRTGSTVLAKYLHNLYPSLDLFTEPYQEHQQYFLEYTKTKSDYILKFHPGMSEYPLELFSNATLIKLRRKNLVEQFASFYVLMIRGLDSYDKIEDSELEKFANTEVPIDTNMMKKAIIWQQQYNDALNNINLNFDYDLYYEDLPKLTESKITPKPLNYQIIKDYMQTLIEQQT